MKEKKRKIVHTKNFFLCVKNSWSSSTTIFLSIPFTKTHKQNAVKKGRNHRLIVCCLHTTPFFKKGHRTSFLYAKKTKLFQLRKLQRHWECRWLRTLGKSQGQMGWKPSLDTRTRLRDSRPEIYHYKNMRVSFFFSFDYTYVQILSIFSS